MTIILNYYIILNERSVGKVTLMKKN